MRKKSYGYLLLFAVSLFFLAIAGCKKKDYFIDSGRHSADYNGTVLQYLKNHSLRQFDSLTKVIRLAGMENVFENESITFFATPDTMINRSVKALNQNLFSLGRDTISDLSQLKPAFWKKQLSMYLFKGERRLKDYTQVDPGMLQTFPGQYYQSYDGKTMLVGVIFNDAGGVRYAGYRQLMISYFSGNVPPTGVLPYVNMVASSDIHPTNGIIHALQWSNERLGTGSNRLNTPYMGFSENDFITDAKQIGLDF